jgi:ABC-2 type transport system permease protein
MLGRLIGAKLTVVKGSLKSNNEGKHRAPLFIVLSVIFSAMLYRGSFWLVTNALELQPVGELLVQKLVAIAFLIFLGLLTFSNVVSAFSTFYLADDLEFLWAQPIHDDSLFASRYIESLVQSSWVIVLFGMPAFTALGVGMNADWTYYAMLLAVFLPFVAIPTGVATIAALLITNMLVASRMRDGMLFLGMLGFGVLFAVVRVMQPEKLLNPESFDGIGEMIQLLSTPRTSFLPSDWAVNVLSPLIFDAGAFDWWSLGLLYLTPMTLFVVSAWLHRPMYFRGYSRVQEGRHGTGLITTLRDWAMSRQRQRAGSVAQNLEAMAQEEGSFRSLKQLVRKDRVIFTRDASQWSNLLVIVALMTIYLVNYKYFDIISDTKLFGEVGLYYFNLAVCGFVIVALSGRFLFPAISIEGRSFWMVLQAPISLERVLVGKWLGAMLPVAFVGQGVIWASNLLVVQNWFYTLFASVLVFGYTLCVAAIAVGMGAIYPQFHNPNAANVSSSFGAMIFMVMSIIMILFSLAFTFRLVTRLGRIITDGSTEAILMGDVATFCLGLLMPAAAAYIAIRLGARSLRARL